MTKVYQGAPGRLRAEVVVEDALLDVVVLVGLQEVVVGRLKVLRLLFLEVKSKAVGWRPL